MAGRWGGDIKGRRRGEGGRRRREWQAPRTPPPPRMVDRLRAGGVVLAGAGFYLVALAGALLTLTG